MALNVELLLEACVTRFNAHANLKATGRKLSMVRQSTRPWTEFEVIGHATMDGFSDDIVRQTIRFTYHGKQPKPRNASNWLEYMTDAFDDATAIAVTGYTTSGVNRLDADDGPELIDDVWEARTEHEFILHRDALLPAIRGS